MDKLLLLFDLIPLIIFSAIGIVAGIILFPRLNRYLGRSPLHCLLAIGLSALAAFAVFMVIAVLFFTVRGRWCEGCQEYH